jgi:hypothetical protein
MKKFALVLFGSILTFGLSSQSKAANGTVAREETNTRSGFNAKFVCDSSVATLRMDLTGFNLHYAPKNCRDAAGNEIEVVDRVIGATSFSADGDLTSTRSTGRIKATGLEYEKIARDGTTTKLKVEAISVNEFNFVLERTYADGFKRTDVGQFR